MKTIAKNTPRKYLFLTLILMLLLIYPLCFLNAGTDINKKSTNVLNRAKDMLASLPASEDNYGLKEVFKTAEILPASFNGEKIRVITEPEKQYSIIFLLPEKQEDYKKFGGPKDAVMYTATNINPQFSIPVYIVINPEKIMEYDDDGVSLDYLASCMLHETVHVYQRSLILRRNQNVSCSLEAVKQREKEAYAFQAKFIKKILLRNKIDTKISVPIFDIKKINREGLSNLCQEIDKLNGYKLGPVASLIAFDAYPDLYVSIANSLYIGE